MYVADRKCRHVRIHTNLFTTLVEYTSSNHKTNIQDDVRIAGIEFTVIFFWPMSNFEFL